MRINKRIETKEDIINILNKTKEIVMACNENEDLYELYLGYDNFCEDIQIDILCEIDSALIGNEKLNSENIANANIRMMTYWSYLDDEIDLDELFNTLKEYSNKTLIEI
jgi:hypothetical protein